MTGFPRMLPGDDATGQPGAQRALIGASDVFGTGVPGNIAFNTTNFEDEDFDLSDPTAIAILSPGRFIASWAFSWAYLPAPGTMPANVTLQTGIGLTAPGQPAVVIISQLSKSIADTPNTHSGASIVEAVTGTAFRLFAYQNSGSNRSSWRFVGPPGEIQAPPTLTIQRLHV